MTGPDREAASAQVREVEASDADAIGAIIFRDWDANERSEGGPTEYLRGRIRAFIAGILAPAAEPAPVAQGDVDRAFLTLTREDSTPEEIEARMFLMRYIADHARIVVELEAQLSRKTRECELKSHAIDRWIPCPDHRDKTERGACLVCAKEKAEASLAACRADAKRYRALRERASRDGSDICFRLQHAYDDYGMTNIDAAIDAARSQP